MVWLDTAFLAHAMDHSHSLAATVASAFCSAAAHAGAGGAGAGAHLQAHAACSTAFHAEAPACSASAAEHAAAQAAGTVFHDEDKDLSCDPAAWGPAAWKFMHAIARNLPAQVPGEVQESLGQFVAALPKVLPCHTCGDHLQRHIAEDPIGSHLGTRAEVERWFVDLHNKVNVALGKPVLSVHDGSISAAHACDNPNASPLPLLTPPPSLEALPPRLSVAALAMAPPPPLWRRGSPAPPLPWLEVRRLPSRQVRHLPARRVPCGGRGGHLAERRLVFEAFFPMVPQERVH